MQDYESLSDDLQTSKVGLGDLFLVVQSEFVSWSVSGRWQVSVYSSYDLCLPG